MSHLLTGHQPARVILVETSNPRFTTQTSSLICDALENALCISSNMAGPSRIPLFGMYLLSSYPEVILPLTCTKGNFVRLHAALGDIRNFFEASLEHHQSMDLKPCIAEGVSEACSQFRRYTNSSPQTQCKQVEVILITGHSGLFVQQQLRSLPDHFDLSSIKRIVSATVEAPIAADLNLGCDAASSTLEMDCDGFSGMVDCLTIDCDPASLQKFFYSWFTETSSEIEHLQLVLPPPCPADPSLVIKCDVSEKLICPHQLPLSDAFTISTESSICKYIYPPPSKTLGMTLPVQRLEVVGVVSRQDVCESILFGFPLVLTPTTCWKMEWDELETNQENFASVCSELNEKDQVLLTQAACTDETSHQRPARAAIGNKCRGYFLLMPSSNKTVLIKNVIPQELLLPASPVVSSDATKPESILRIKASLSEVKCLPDLNPLTLKCGLMPALLQTSLPRSAVDKARSVKNTASSASGPVRFNKVPAGQKDIGSFFSAAQRSVQRPTQPVPGSRLTANHWSAPLVNVNKTRQTKTNLNM